MTTAGRVSPAAASCGNTRRAAEASQAEEHGADRADQPAPARRLPGCIGKRVGEHDKPQHRQGQAGDLETRSPSAGRSRHQRMPRSWRPPTAWSPAAGPPRRPGKRGRHQQAEAGRTGRWRRRRRAQHPGARRHLPAADAQQPPTTTMKTRTLLMHRRMVGPCLRLLQGPRGLRWLDRRSAPPPPPTTTTTTRYKIRDDPPPTRPSTTTCTRHAPGRPRSAAQYPPPPHTRPPRPPHPPHQLPPLDLFLPFPPTHTPPPPPDPPHQTAAPWCSRRSLSSPRTPRPHPCAFPHTPFPPVLAHGGFPFVIGSHWLCFVCSVLVFLIWSFSWGGWIGLTSRLEASHISQLKHR